MAERPADSVAQRAAGASRSRLAVVTLTRGCAHASGPATQALLAALAELDDTARTRPQWCQLSADLHLAEHDPRAALDSLTLVLDARRR